MIYNPRQERLQEPIILKITTSDAYHSFDWMRLGCPYCYSIVEQLISPDDIVIYQCFRCGWKYTDGR